MVRYVSADDIPDGVYTVLVSCAARVVQNREQIKYLSTDGGYATRWDSPGLHLTPP